MPLRRADTPKARELFAREARVLRQLDHPRIPRHLDDFVTGRGKHAALVLVEELVPGEDLAHEVEGHRHTEAEVLAILEDLLPILAYLHGLSPPVVHRDVKPRNVMRRPDGSLVLLDFGAVRDAAVDPELGGSTVAGTFGYMAPEQFRGDASPASDLYGAGALAVALLTRREPHRMADPSGRVHWREWANVSAPFADLLDRLLEPDESRRPSSAAAALDDVRRVRRGEAPRGEAPRSEAPRSEAPRSEAPRGEALRALRADPARAPDPVPLPFREPPEPRITSPQALEEALERRAIAKVGSTRWERRALRRAERWERRAARDAEKAARREARALEGRGSRGWIVPLVVGLIAAAALAFVVGTLLPVVLATSAKPPSPSAAAPLACTPVVRASESDVPATTSRYAFVGASPDGRRVAFALGRADDRRGELLVYEAGADTPIFDHVASMGGEPWDRYVSELTEGSAKGLRDAGIDTRLRPTSVAWCGDARSVRIGPDTWSFRPWEAPCEIGFGTHTSFELCPPGASDAAGCIVPTRLTLGCWRETPAIVDVLRMGETTWVVAERAHDGVVARFAAGR
jgi:hypothetical protein